MSHSEHDTIVAIATPPGRGGVGIVRLSGTRVPELALALLGMLPPPRHAALRTFRDAHGEAIDSGIALYFPAPHSFTGEEVLELHGHGGPVVLDMLLSRLVQLGARLAAPGEFSRRAFLNDKLDLVEAEAIADLIAADSSQAVRAALRSMRGEFSQALHALTEALVTARMHIEAAIDFPDEELDLLQDEMLLKRMEHALQLAADIERDAHQGSLLREGMTIVIAGKPNAGKSSLLNRLAGYEAAIVTEVPGTTRDVLRERIHIDGLPLHVIDTAGLRVTEDRVEAEGVRRAHAEISKADRVLYVVDVTQFDEAQVRDELAQLPTSVPVSIVINKIDRHPTQTPHIEAEPPRIYLSAHTGAGLALLREHLKACIGYASSETAVFLARRRHLDALQRATHHLRQAQHNLTSRQAGELCAEELRVAQQALGEITGEFTSEDLLGRIFSTFCIGK